MTKKAVAGFATAFFVRDKRKRNDKLPQYLIDRAYLPIKSAGKIID